MIPTSRRSIHPRPMTDRDPCIYCEGNVGTRQEAFDCDGSHRSMALVIQVNIVFIWINKS